MDVKEQIVALDELYHLKKTYRALQVGDRFESSAEHSWGTLVVADWLLSFVSETLDRTRVYELLMYHDLVEAECGDVPISPDVDTTLKARMEEEAAESLARRLPPGVASKFLARFSEFEKRESREALFAKVVDGFESDTFARQSDLDWSKWSISFYRSLRLPFVEQFPELLPLFYELESQLIAQQIVHE